MVNFFASNPYNITAQSIGLPHSTTTLGGGLAVATEELMKVVGLVAIVMIIVSGIQMAVSAGNPKRFATARETLLYAVVGLGVSIGALALVTFVAGSVNGGH